MAQENKTQNISLEDRLLQIDLLNQINREIDKSRLPSERVQLYKNLAQILSENDQSKYDKIYGDIRVSPEEAINYSTDKMNKTANETNETYKKNKEKILNEIVSSMKSIIKEAKTKAEVAQILSIYFKDLIKVPELDQATLDYMARKELASEVGVSMNYTATGSMNEFRSLQEKIYASEFIKEIKNEKGISYAIDKEKLSKEMDKIVYGSILYGNMKRIESEIKKAEKKIA